ncbi:MAG TPA: tetratricopeptide repeat protein [Candidatus Brocadiia bacterium]|nr:tetratricopeptide repeat protein [Candidatus Brocadiia bacterium]
MAEDRNVLSGLQCPLKTERLTRAGALLVIAATLALFIPALGYDYADWDDQVFVLFNPRVTAPGVGWVIESFRGPYQGYYAPVLWNAFRAGHAIWGLNPGGFHGLNILLHCANAVMVIIICRRLGAGPPAAVIAGFIWAIHPLRVESVAWIPQLKDCLSGAFALAACLCWLRAADASGAVELDNPSGRAFRMFRLPVYIAGVVLFALALGAKATVSTWPLVIALIELFRRAWPVAPEKGKSGDFDRFWKYAKAILVEIAPMLALSAAAGLVMIRSQKGIGAVDQTNSFDLGRNILVAARSFIFHLEKLFWPSGLSTVYLLEQPVTLANTPFTVGFLGCIVLGALLVIFFDRFTWASFALCFFAIAFLPMSQLIPTARPYADRYTYLPSIGIAAAVAMGIQYCVIQIQDRKIVAGAASWLLVAPIAIALFSGARARLPVWNDALTLWAAEVRNNPNEISYNNYGTNLIREGLFEEAALQFQNALRDRPDVSDYYLNMALARAAMGQENEAEQAARACIMTAMGIQDMNEAADMNLPGLLSQIGLTERALAAGIKARQIGRDKLAAAEAAVKKESPAVGGETQPSQPLELKTSGETTAGLPPQQTINPEAGREIDQQMTLLICDCMAKLGRYDEAITELEQALAKWPDFEPAQMTLVGYIMDKGDCDLAEKKLREFITGKDKAAQLAIALAEIEARRGNPEEAARIASKAITDFPSEWTFRNNLAHYMLAAGKDLDEAEDLARHAVDALGDAPASPDSPLFVFDDTLAWVYYRRGKFRLAEAHMGRHKSYLWQNAETAFHWAAISEKRDRPDRAGRYVSIAIRKAGATDKWLPEAQELANRLGVTPATK